RTSRFWEDEVCFMSDADFRSNFRISRTTFQMFCGHLETKLARKDTKWRKAIPLDKRIAIAIYWLSSTSEMRTVSNLFGLGKSSVCKIIHEFCTAVIDHYLNGQIVFPTNRTKIN